MFENLFQLGTFHPNRAAIRNLGMIIILFRSLLPVFFPMTSPPILFPSQETTPILFLSQRTHG